MSHATFSDAADAVTPRDAALDSTLSLLREGYRFIGNRCHRLGSDVFVTRLMGKRAICMQGSEAARVFYDESRLQRGGAVPRRVVTSLFGKRGVQSLDGESHRQRKLLLLSLSTPARLKQLVDITSQQWRLALTNWQQRERIVLFDEAHRLLTRAVCSWAGVPLPETELAQRARDFELMVDAFGGVGPRLWRGKRARARAESWLESLICESRSGRIQVATDSALAQIAAHRDQLGQLLKARVAAVELINVLRPTAAIAWYVTFAALALHEHPECRARLLTDSSAFEPAGYAHCFMQEVRRFYPFTPFVGAKVKEAFDWRGHRFDSGALVLLDVYGTLHDARIWSDPDTFRPERFQNRQITAFDLIPQGGGEPLGHRCAGEWLTMELLAQAVDVLTRSMTYQVLPQQDLRFSLSRMPTRPHSGFVIGNVRDRREQL
jgi:fatty-acid peroxygenase